MPPRVNERRNKDGTTTYFVRLRDAQNRQTSERFTSKAEATTFAKRVDRIGRLEAIAEKNRKDRMTDHYVPTLREWFDTYLETSTGITDGTRNDYTYVANRVMLPLLGDLTLDAVDRTQVARYVNELERTPRIINRGKNRGKPAGGTLSAKTISNHHGLLSALMKRAVIEGHVPTNPCLGVRLPRANESERRDERFITHDEWEVLIAAIPPKHQPLITTLVGTGLRWSEATALQVRDLDPKAGSLRVVRAWKKTGVKNGKRKLGPPKTPKSRRRVEVPQQVWDLILPLVDGQPPEAWVFRNRVGNAWHHGSFTSRYWAPAARLLDPQPRIHDLRHTHASWLIEQGATLEQVQDQLGHESILTTRGTYGHLQPAMRESLREAATRSLTPTSRDRAPIPYPSRDALHPNG